MLFIGALRDGQAVGMPVLHWFAVGEKHIVVGTVAGDVVERQMPATGDFAGHGDGFPMGKRANHLNFGRRFGVAMTMSVGMAMTLAVSVRRMPAENFAKYQFARFSFMFVYHFCKWTFCLMPVWDINACNRR